MLEFYEFNTINICIVLVSIFIIYNILCRINNTENEHENKNLNIESLFIAGISGLIISLLCAYFLTEKDEKLLTGNFWDIIPDTE